MINNKMIFAPTHPLLTWRETSGVFLVSMDDVWKRLGVAPWRHWRHGGGMARKMIELIGG